MRFLSLVVCVTVLGALGGCGDDDNVTDVRLDARDGEVGECTDGQQRCVGNVSQTCEGGLWGAGVSCEESGDICYEGLGCVVCRPGVFRCEGNDVMQCQPDGESWLLADTCDPAEGETCEELTGVCINPCAIAARDRSNIGCEYWAVDLDNAENSTDWAAAAQFAVVVANLSNLYASEVRIEVDDGLPGEAHALREVDRAGVPPLDLHVFNLPRWDVDGDNAEGVDDDPQTGLSRRVYRVTSTTPVVAYAFNPIEQAFSNGALVLLPTTALDAEYYAVGWPPANPMRMPALGLNHPNRVYVTVVGVEDGTTVWVTPTHSIFEGVGQPEAGILPVAPIDAGVETEFALDQFDVLNLEGLEMNAFTDPLPDLTGTLVHASGPVVVYVGVDLAVVGGVTLPDGTTDACCAEYMGAQITPVSTMGNNFVVSRSPIRAQPGSGWTEYDHYRVLAVRPDTHVTTTLPGADADFMLGQGEWREFSTRDGFTLQSDPPVHVVQFISSMEQCYDWRPGAGGDGDMMYVPPVEQRRNNYIFTTGVGFSENWAVVSMPTGASATIDGADVATTCTPTYADGELDGTVYRAYHCRIEDGRHEVLADGLPVGVIVYGYYGAGSYAYPAGSNLNRIFFG
ncbi:MAG: IgGFc-binding protein [Deltaproteobacteria bacterium]|nr:IgGFc-binding protein [Deltaproteobacteria bacterium]